MHRSAAVCARRRTNRNPERLLTHKTVAMVSAGTAFTRAVPVHLYGQKEGEWQDVSILLEPVRSHSGKYIPTVVSGRPFEACDFRQSSNRPSRPFVTQRP